MTRHGPLVGPAGTTFRLWAPAAKTVELVVDRPLPMPSEAPGWYALTLPAARAGTRYKFRIDGEIDVPDPASAFQPDDVGGPSEVIDHGAYDWRSPDWRGRPWNDAAILELHVGTFTPEGTFRAAIDKLDHVAQAGFTAIELMPVADFAGSRNWGYDGVLLYAPDSAYGRPDDLRALVDAAHRRGLMVLLDVVYNHFGPEGNYLHRYAPDFFNPRHQTPWGDGVNYDGPGSEVVRAFMIHNALYWIEEFHLDGLRLDAVNAIVDESPRHLLVELARAGADGPGRERRVHLVLENGANEARYLRREAARRPLYQAQWNDDVHHALHILLTGETGGYYADYQPPLPHLGRCLAEGFAFQGERSGYRDGPRGEPSAHLPPTAFVSFLQNHDQVGNRALGERITALAAPEAVRAATAVLLLAPALPLLFMGEEWAAPEPFLFFTDLGPDLGPAVAEGRRREFARFPEFASPEVRERIPDPQAASTRARSVLDWSRLAEPTHRDWLDFHRTLLRLRAEAIVPLQAGEPVPAASWKALGDTALEVTWAFPAGTLRLVTNLGPAAVPHPGVGPDWGRRLHALRLKEAGWRELPPWSVAFYLAEPVR